MCEYCELIFPAESHAEHVEYCGSRTDLCPRCDQFVKLRDRKLHEESNCTLPLVVTPPSASAADDFVCDGMDAYRLSQLDHFLCHDIAGGSFWPSSGPHAFLGRNRQPNRMPQMGRMNPRSHGFMKRNCPDQLMDRGDGIQAAGPKNNDAIVYRPKVMNRPQRGNSTSVPNSDDAGKFCTIRTNSTLMLLLLLLLLLLFFLSVRSLFTCLTN